ncbi:MAG TPA: ArdC-like ssDNA-binding domain-containing protein [Lactovum miscens]|uniref:ArdC-like ssDNA-binding domain-containing protein n=1 Tax=Lactovum miscens TaxID=190387 RepID=UPI002ED857C7
MSNYKLVTIDQKFIAETVARTGSDELMEKATRSYVGLYDTDENWYIPLRANLGKKPRGAYFNTPFETKNPHFKHPGLDFQKAIYVPVASVIEINNTLPKKQSNLIFSMQNQIKKEFENYVLRVEQFPNGSKDFLWSTVPLFPEGIKKIKEKLNEQHSLLDNRANILQEDVGFFNHNERQEVNKDTMKIYRGLIADDQKTADKWIKSTKTIQATAFGKGMYWTQSPLIAMEYGNFVYSAEIRSIEAKKILEAQDIVLLTAETHKGLSPSLEATLDLGINANYKFKFRDWHNPENINKMWRSEEFEQKEIETMHQGDIYVPEFLKPLTKGNTMAQRSEGAVNMENLNISVNELIKNKDYKGLSQHLKTGIQDYLKSDNFKNYLKFISKFHKYSSNNNRLLLTQNPEVSHVAGMKKWNILGRKVNKGSKALYVYAPTQVIKKDKDGKPVLDAEGKPKKETYFFLTPVFDVSQTNGEELPKQIYELTENLEDPQRFLKLYKGLCEVSPVKVSLEDFPGGANGYYDLKDKRIVLQQGMGEEMTLKTLIHEITHASIHEGSDATFGDAIYARQEFEAESVAYVVSNYLGIDTSSYSFAYLSSWTVLDGQSLDHFEKSLETITTQAQITIDKLEASLNKVYGLENPKNKFEERLVEANKKSLETPKSNVKKTQPQPSRSKMTPPLLSH